MFRHKFFILHELFDLVSSGFSLQLTVVMVLDRSKWSLPTTIDSEPIQANLESLQVQCSFIQSTRREMDSIGTFA